MKIKDSTIISMLLFLYMLVTISVLGSDAEISRLEKKIDELYNTQQEQILSYETTNLERIRMLEEQILAIEEKNRMQDIRLQNHFNELGEHTQRFTDLLHEVNSFEDAVENLTPAHITLPTTWKGKRLSRTAGVVNGPSGRETYYNMDMSFCISRMRRQGYSEKDYPYWVRDDGCKMLGQYVMVAANFRIRPLGTILETSVGWAIVVDTGGFVRQYPKGIDVATTW